MKEISKKTYLILTVILFLFEIAILIFWEKNLFIRGFAGDLIAVIFLYTLIKSVVNIKSLYGAILSFAVGVILEIGQYYHFAKIINMESNRVFTVLFGSNFDKNDILAYFIGGLTVVLMEKIKDLSTASAKNRNE